MLQILKEHLQFKTQIFKLSKADLRKTYRGSALGWSWAIIKPTITIFVFWFAFTIGLRAGKDVAGYPFFLWLLSGLVPWFFMSEMITQGTEAIRRYSYLVTRMKFPVSTIPTFVSLSKLFIHSLMMIIVITIFIFMGYGIDIYFLQLPVYMFFMFLFFTAWALFSAPLAAISKDYANLVKSLITAVFWLSGILWNPHTIHIPWLKKLLMVNPVTYLTNGYRNVFIYKTWFFDEWKTLVAFLIVLSIMIILGVRTYKKLRKEIPDVL